MSSRLPLLLAAVLLTGSSDCGGNLGTVSTLSIATVRVSVRADGSQANGGSRPRIGGNGRYVFFDSDAFDLVGGDTNNVRDVFRKDRFTGQVRLVSTDGNGNLQSKPSALRAISNNGTYVLYHYDTPGPSAPTTDHGMLYVKNVEDNSNVAVVDLNWAFQYDLQGGAVSEDGLSVAFQSYTDDFPGFTNSPQMLQVYLSDLSVFPPTIRLVSSTVANGAVGGNNNAFDPDLTGDGQLVVFASPATNLQGAGTDLGSDVYIWTRTSGALQTVSRDAAGVEADGTCGTPSISLDGRFVAFETTSALLQPMRVAVRDRGDPAAVPPIPPTTISAYDEPTVQPPPPFMLSVTPRIGKGGQHVLFNSNSNLLAGTGNGFSHVFVRNFAGGGIVRASINSLGEQANSNGFNAEISVDGRWVLWNSFADNLVGGDTNNATDVFVRGPY